MGSLIFKAVSKKGKDLLDKLEYKSVLDIPAAPLLGGNAAPLSSNCEGKKAVLIVNVATKWGLTDKNYKEMVQLHKEFEDQGFQILGFPCNQFGGQEPGTPQEIDDFARGKYGVTFPMYEKIEVNGSNTHPVYNFLRMNSELRVPDKQMAGEIPWNFAKFLVSCEGQMHEGATQV